jgi:energy-coupling factor transporter ATP-binding protein EcfA2
MSTKEALIAALDEALLKSLQLRRSENVGDFTGPGKHARYLCQPKLTVASHFDIDPAFLLFDPLLGTIGVVEVILPPPSTDNGTEAPASTSGESVETQVHRAIDRASYLRHLLVRDKTRKEARPLTVELVLLTADETPDDEVTVAAIGDVVRGVLRSADSLYHVGFGVLLHGGPSAGFDQRLRRAFPWLLTATRRWFASPRARAVEPPSTPPGTAAGPAVTAPGPTRTSSRLRRLTLENYRLSAKRAITLAAAPARVHLLHGANGSGKSSVAEALELLVTGKIERIELAAESNYDTVIRHRNRAAQAATIGFQLGNDHPNARTVVPKGLDEPLAREIDVSSFRLDQALMDRLIGLSAHARAQVFLRAFFPEALLSLQRFEKATELHTTALAQLQGVVGSLRLARETLVDLKSWKSGAATSTAEEFPVLLDRWLEQTAFLDLVQRVRSVHQTLGEARRSGWQPISNADPAIHALESAVDGPAFERFEAESKLLTHELKRKLNSFAPSGAVSRAATPDGAISAAQVDALNSVSPFLFDSEVLSRQGRFGQKLRGVMHAGEMPTYGHVVIGEGEWADLVLKDIDALLAACQALETDEPLSLPWPGRGPCSQYDAARATHEGRSAAGQALARDFLDKLRPDAGAEGEFDGSLVAALNELLALFTPARWAYPDIKIPAVLSDGKVGVPLQFAGKSGADTRAELHLNTAELNLFTVALFLLCIGRVKKPLNLLVLDDPLQNMDELTTTALARGIAKLVRLWEDLGDRPESLVVLFHGQDDLERFHAEIAAAVYHLPWLSPSSLNTEKEIVAEGALADTSAVQSLEGLTLEQGA